MNLPHLTEAQAPLTCDVSVIDECGEQISVSIPAERALTVYVDKRELVTLMTLGARPELLVLGYLLNQRLVKEVNEIESITVDWDVGAAAVKTRSGIADIEEKTARRVVTTGCGQGSVFGGLMDEVEQIKLPPDCRITQSQLYQLVNTIRLKETTYKSAGSVHACALFDLNVSTGSEPDMLIFVEDVGRHNAIDTIAGWMAMNVAPTLDASFIGLSASNVAFKAPSEAPVEKDAPSSRLAFYTTGRLTSEMVIKSAQMGVAIVVSRSGITQMGHEVAAAVGLCAIGRATNKRFVCYTSAQRLLWQPELLATH